MEKVVVVGGKLSIWAHCGWRRESPQATPRDTTRGERKGDKLGISKNTKRMRNASRDVPRRKETGRGEAAVA